MISEEDINQKKVITQEKGGGLTRVQNNQDDDYSEDQEFQASGGQEEIEITEEQMLDTAEAIFNLIA